MPLSSFDCRITDADRSYFLTGMARMRASAPKLSGDPRPELTLWEIFILT